MSRILDLSVPERSLILAVEGYPLNAEFAIHQLDEQMLRVVSTESDPVRMNHLTLCRDWLGIMSNVLLELRTSLAYAKAHMAQLSPGDRNAVQRPEVVTVSYFAQNAGLRLFSVRDKAAQFVRAYHELPVDEKASFKAILREAAGRAGHGPLAQIDTALNQVSEIRNALVHRYDPRWAQTQVIAVNSPDCPDMALFVWSNGDPVAEIHEQLAACEGGYFSVDDLLKDLIAVIAADFQEKHRP